MYCTACCRRSAFLARKLNGRTYTASNVCSSFRWNATPTKLCEATSRPQTSASMVPSAKSVPPIQISPMPGEAVTRTAVPPLLAAASRLTVRSRPAARLSGRLMNSPDGGRPPSPWCDGAIPHSDGARAHAEANAIDIPSKAIAIRCLVVRRIPRFLGYELSEVEVTAVSPPPLTFQILHQRARVAVLDTAPLDVGPFS